jgi:pyruvate formate-lyase activating enzyme-like uncharacterized protein
MNEFEYSDTNHIRVSEKGFETRDNLSYAIKDSREMGVKILNYILKNYPKMNVHLCTAKLKDSVQMRNRIKLRAKNVKKPYDIVSKDGTLIRGAIYLNEMLPNSTYKSKLEKMSLDQRKKIMASLKN